MLGAHLDSWDLGTGAHDDGAGVAQRGDQPGEFLIARGRIAQHGREWIRRDELGPVVGFVKFLQQGPQTLQPRDTLLGDCVQRITLPPASSTTEFVRSLPTTSKCSRIDWL